MLPITLSLLLLLLAPPQADASSASRPQAAAFAPAPGSPVWAGSMAGEPVVADMDRDGRPDVVLACGTCCGSRPDPKSGHVVVLLGDGSGGFRPAPGSPVPVGSSARKVAVGDLDGDGDQDVVVGQHDLYEIVVLLGDGKGGLSPGSPVIAGRGARPHTHDVTLADVDGDGHL